MRRLVRGLAVLLLLSAAAPPVRAKCGQAPGDEAAVEAVATAPGWPCGCCRLATAGQRRRCALRAAKIGVRAGTLPRRCLDKAAHAAARSCRGIGVACPLAAACLDARAGTCTATPCSAAHPCPAPGAVCSPTCAASPPPTTSTTVLPGSTTTLPGCTADAQCDDGNPCTHDTCTSGACAHECVCADPTGRATCCPGPAADCPLLRYFSTCGDPVCRVGGQRPHPGVPPCTSERAGAPCSTPGTVCDPGDDCNRLLECTTRQPGPCPISRRAAKRGIRYLTDADLRRLHDALLALRLATYRYRADGSHAHEQLGFVIDDVGPSPAVDAGGDVVDLYGYASMAVAAIQAQARQISALEAEVAALRREVQAAERRAAGR